MNVFLSWSGPRSKVVAEALKDWLPLVLHYVEPWMSHKDIEAGDRWGIEIAKALEDSGFAVLCLVPENLSAPWILFEAGAVSKALTTASVCPYLLGVDYRDLSGPLGQFQAKKAERDGTRELLHSINAKAATPLAAERFARLFDSLWPDLEVRLKAIPSSQPSQRKQARPQAEVLDDLVKVVRAMDSRLARLSRVVGSGTADDSGEVEFSEVTEESPSRHRILELSGPGDERRTVILDGIGRSGPRAFHWIARRTGLALEEYGTTWVVEDANGGALTREQLADFTQVRPSEKRVSLVVRRLP